MKERGKAVESYNDNYSDYNYSASDLPCKKHPSSSSVGICAYCLKDRLIKLVCSDCGEQRLSSCSCSEEISSQRNSCTMEVGSVGRISFLIENEKTETHTHHFHNSKPKSREGSEQVILLKRSSSSCVEVKKTNGLWKIGRFFRKKRDKVGGGVDDKSETWMSDCMGVSRSRSLCSFRGGGFNDPDHEGSDFVFSSAKISDVTAGLILDSEKQCGLNETEPRKSGFTAENGFDFKGLKKGGILELDGAFNPPNRSVFPVKESDFSAMDESGFIDLKLDLSSESKVPEYSALKLSDVSDLGSLRGGGAFLGGHQCGDSFGGLKGDGVFTGGGSCRITVNDIGIKRGRGHKVWKWIFRHHPGGRSASKKDENQILRP